VSLSKEPAFRLLKEKFVCGWKDIGGEPYCGRSGEHSRDNPAVLTTNGAGPTNAQLFLLAADGTVLHCLPGYWDARDLACEIQLAEKLNAVWLDASLTPEEKRGKFREMHLGHIHEHSRDMVERSVMQGFDKKFESKHRPETSDCILREGSARPKYRPKRDDEFKTTDQIMHERIARQPFVSYGAFDVAGFATYGRPKYDKGGDDSEEQIAECRRQMEERKRKMKEREARREAGTR
jgi:hypothetical protein